MFTVPFNLRPFFRLAALRRAALAALTLWPALHGVVHAAETMAAGLASEWTRNPQGELGLIAGGKSAKESNAIWIGLDFRPLPGWKIYWRSPGDAGFPPHVDWTGSDNLASASIEWPAPQRFSVSGLETAGYEGELVLPILATPSSPNRSMHLQAKIDYLTCTEICVPEHATLALTVPAGGADAGPDSVKIDHFRALVPGNGADQGLALVSVSATSNNRLKVVVKADPPLTAPDLFVERADQLPFGKPDIQRDSGGRVTFTVKPGTDDSAAKLAGSAATLTIVDGTRSMEAGVQIAAPQSADSIGLILTMLGIALLGGLILNVMPCVLPVFSIKLLSIVGQRDETPGAMRASFLAQAAGIVVSFLILAGATLAAKGGGAEIGWGLQFQMPVFLVALTIIVTLFAANLFGLYEIALPGWAAAIGSSGAGQNKNLVGAFLSGVFATLLATPCSAPFLGTAIGFALARGPGEILLIFTALGIGMALPYLALATWPGWARHLPRPGQWMIVVRRILGLALVGTAIWLLFVLAAETGWPATLVVTVLMVTSMAVLMDRRLPGMAQAGAIVLLATGALIVPSTIPVFPGFTAAKPSVHEWKPFNRASIDGNVTAGKVVFVDVTARWCLTCQVNKAAVIDNEPATSLLAGNDVVAMQADWTRPDPAISDYLADFGRYGIPFDVIYGPGAPHGIALPELLTQAALVSAYEKAKKPAS